MDSKYKETDKIKNKVVMPMLNNGSTISSIDKEVADEEHFPHHYAVIIHA